MNLKLIHVSRFPNLKTLDPKYQGSGAAGAERQRPDFKKPSYVNFYVNSPKVYLEGMLRRGFVYSTVVSTDVLYDIYAEGGDKYSNIKKAGYKGIYFSEDNQVHYFYPINVKYEGEIDPSKTLGYNKRISTDKISKFLMKEFVDNYKKSASEMNGVVMKENTIIEASVSRVYDHYKSGEFVTISANSSANSSEENQTNWTVLKNFIVKELNLGFVGLDGIGQEEENGVVKKVKEYSFFVPNIERDTNKPIENFKTLFLNKAKELNQFSILYGDGSGTVSNIITLPQVEVGGKIFKFGETFETYTNFKSGVSKYFSRIRSSGKPFFFKEIKRQYCGINTCGFMEAMSRHSSGELTDFV